MEIYQSYLKSIARTLRNNMTESERLIWSIIRNKKLKNERTNVLKLIIATLKK